MAKLLSPVFAVALAACHTAQPASARVHNQLSGDDDARIVERVWWSVALFEGPFAPGALSGSLRVVQDRAYAYAVITRADDPDAMPIAVRTREPVAVERGKRLTIVLSPDTIVGDCALSEPLSQEDADFITQRIFPGVFAGLSYDAARCTAQPADEPPSP